MMWEDLQITNRLLYQLSYVGFGSALLVYQIGRLQTLERLVIEDLDPKCLIGLQAAELQPARNIGSIRINRA